MNHQKRIGPLGFVLILSALFFVLFVGVSSLFFFSRPSSFGNSSRGSSSSFFRGDSVGVIELNGVIQDSRKTLARLEKFEEDDQIKAVVLRLNSPGGSVAPSQEIYEAVKHYKKPLVVSMGSTAASGAYYIACGAKKVFANPGTLTGSIGVIMEFANLEKLYEWAKVQRYAIKTGKFKDVGAEYRQMSPEEKNLLQTMVDDILSQFKHAVASGRKLSMEQVSAIADGRIFSGNQAKTLHLVDELGTLKDAVQEAAKMANIKGKPNVVYMEKQKRNILDFLFDDSSNRDDSESSLSGFEFLSQFKKLLGNSGSSVLEAPSLLPGIYILWKGVN